MRFDTFAVIDWSGGNDTGPRPRKDAIWAGLVRAGRAEAPRYLRNRRLAEDWLADLVETELTAGRRLCLGFDFPFGYPAGFAGALTGTADPFALWDWLEARIEDAPKANTRFDLAGEINRTLGAGRGPFWANGLKRDIPGLPRGKESYANPFPERRAAEQQAPGAFTCWQLAGAGAVGGQVLMGLPVLARLRRRFGNRIAAWPFEPLDAPVALIEVWPSLLADAVRAEPFTPQIPKDAVQVRLLAAALAGLSPDAFAQIATVDAPEEGWIFGLGHEETLRAALPALLTPPPLRNDCFAMPRGAYWTPVDDALAHLRANLHPVAGPETRPVGAAAGRVVASAVTATRAHPPAANTAVDGYGFAHAAIGPGPQTLPLTPGRAAAGAPFHGAVPHGKALRILTGAVLPEGVDTVVLEEDCTTDGQRIAFRGPLKRGANTRVAGEDITEGQTLFAPGHRLTAADLGTLAAGGLGEVEVRAPLKVAVLSTGDELREPGAATAPGQIPDANRPMLLALLRRWGFETVDLGRAADTAEAVRAALDRGAVEADAILTSGGASAGDEDHISKALRETGSMALWRVAVKPGRPLALGLWNGAPVFGLPGNPVAAFVCTLIFARPALMRLAGADWPEPQGFDVPAAFAKSKKAGRREYLRARLRDGRAEVFPSEGSGRITGLSWAEGLVELGDGARQIEPGDPVRYLPFGSFGL